MMLQNDYNGKKTVAGLLKKQILYNADGCVCFHLLGKRGRTAKSSGLYHRFMLASHGCPNHFPLSLTFILSRENGLVEESKEHGVTDSLWILPLIIIC